MLNADLAGGTETPVVFVAGWDAGAGMSDGLSLSRTVTWDSKPPTVSLEVQTPVNAPWKRDDEVAVNVVADEPFGTSVPNLFYVLSDGGAASVGIRPVAVDGGCSVLVPCSGPCRCYSAELTLAEWPATMGLNGTVRLLGRAVDAIGNEGSSATLAFPVSRVKWTRAVPASGEVRAAPVLDSQGNINIGVTTREDAGAGYVVSIAPDGGTRWSTSVGVVQALALARTRLLDATQAEVVYVAANEFPYMGRLSGLLASDGGRQGLSTADCFNWYAPMFSAPSLVATRGGTEMISEIAAWAGSVVERSAHSSRRRSRPLNARLQSPAPRSRRNSLRHLVCRAWVSAIVVDSRKLGTAPWPKWQRTAGNAGSLDAEFELNPGCL